MMTKTIKRISFFSLFFLSILVGWGNEAYAACQKIDFGSGKNFCFDIIKTSSEFYRAQIIDQQWDFSDLHCDLILPNEDKVVLKKCIGDFRYSGTAQKIELKARFYDQYLTLITNYDFIHGNFDPEKNSFDQANQYFNFQPEILVSENDGNFRNQWLSAILKVRNTGASQDSFDGIVDLSVEKWENGTWRRADISDYSLDRKSYSFSVGEKGEKNLNQFIRFSKSGEFRLVTNIRGTANTASQIFYISDRDWSKWFYWNENAHFYGLGYTDQQYRKLEAIADLWPSVIYKLRADYPKLRLSSFWQSRSDIFYQNMQDVLKNRKSATFSTREVFYQAFYERLSFTIRTR